MTPNKPPSKKAVKAQYNSKSGLGGPAYDKFAPIVRSQPIGVTDSRQLLMPNANNRVFDQGISNSGLPMQEMTPTNGGQHSGRTGPIR